MKHFSQIGTFQKTISKPVSCAGIGLHSGQEINLSLKPAAANSGIRFKRTDVPGKKLIPAYMNRVVDTTFATTISENDISVSTTEHLLAAINGLTIDNIIIELDGPEVPIMDGSAAPFVDLLIKAGTRQLKSYKRLVKVTREISFRDGDRFIRVYPYDGFKVTAEIDFAHDTINQQVHSVAVTPDKFISEIAQARTFGFIDDVKKLQKNGLALGASLDNAVGIDKNGVLNKEGLRYKDEFVRHKIVDIMGDIALLGCPILGHIVAYKSGHSQHLKLMEAIAASPESWEFVEMKKNGQFSVLNKVVARTKAAGNRLLPVLAPPIPGSDLTPSSF
jgi:UDP-3-O-[3-hydroxymyristoyl] N-acetylglucosamine deacetylase